MHAINVTIMEKQRLKISQDVLYKYLKEHDVKISRVADEMGMAPCTVTTCFQHRNNRHGNPLSFTVENIKKLNDSLHTLSEKLRSCILKFGTDKMYTNKHGRTYDPGMIEPINRLGEYLNITAVIIRLLGWIRSKKKSVFEASTAKNYGNISEKDVNAINMEIISVASFLDSVEVVPDENAFDGSKSASSSVE